MSLAIETLPENILVNIDSSRLVQVLADLISNSVKFSPKGDAVYVSLVAFLKRMILISAVSGGGSNIKNDHRTNEWSYRFRAWGG